MDRQIKFRAWEKAFKKMHYKVNLYSINKNGIINKIQVSDKQVLLDIGIHVEIMQFTGLKDKNGCDIYFNDIIQFYWLEEKIGVVTTNLYGHSCIKVQETEYHIENALKGTVIGNIYENPELWK